MFVSVLADQHKLGLLKSVRGLAIILSVMHSRSVGKANPGFLESLVKVCSDELLCLLAGKVGRKGQLSYECLLVQAKTRVQMRLPLDGRPD